MVVFVRVKHLGAVHDIALDTDAPTLGDLKSAIYATLRIPPSKQRLLMPPGPERLPKSDGALLRDSLPADKLPDAPLPPQASPLLMVIGNAEVPVPCVDGAALQPTCATSEPLVCIPHEMPEGLYACSYAAGYVSQDAYYCRTCADVGAADAQHFMCFGCAGVCHAGHETEHWGLHTYLRCDCCTVRCCAGGSAAPTPLSPNASKGHGAPRGTDEPPPLSPRRRCKFLVYSTTEEIPPLPLPINTSNHYPTETKTWCYCKGSDALPEDNEDALNCMLCHNCFFFSHMAHLHTDMFLSVPCYAETSGFNTVGYRCRTCAAEDHRTEDARVFCPPCIVHCHQGHDIDDVPVAFEHQSEWPSQRELKCACGLPTSSGGQPSPCAVSHDVQETRLIDFGCRGGLASSIKPLVPAWMAKQLVGDDELCAFVCASCMMANPWLWDTQRGLQEEGGESTNALGDVTALRRCWKGRLPTDAYRSPGEVGSCVIPCRRKGPCTPLLPAPAADAAPPPNVSTALTGPFTAAHPFPYHGMLIAEEFARFLCQCSDCQASFSKLAPRNSAPPSQLHLFIPFEDTCSLCEGSIDRGHGYLCATCELAGSSCLLCEACATTPAAKEEHCRRAAARTGQQHHEFVQDTLDNLWRVFGAQLLSDGAVDRDTREWMLNNWDKGSVKDVVLNMLRESAFGARRVDAIPPTPTPPAAADGGAADTDDAEGTKKRQRDDSE